jgi:acyl-CoA thioester hydrolase
MHVDQALPKELESTAVIRFQDCDPFGHLNNARYIDYFMNARQDQVGEHYGISFFGEGIQASWVVSKCEIAFLAPARLMETVLIRTRLIHASESILVVEGLMFDSAGQQLKTVAWVTFTYISVATARRTQHTDELMNLFRAVLVGDTFDENGFNQRKEELRSSRRQRPQNVPA